MKKGIRLLSIGILVVAALAALSVSTVFAQDGDNPESTPTAFWGPCDGAGSCINDTDGAANPMHTFMLEALASATGQTAEEIQSRLLAGENMYQIAESAGLSAEEITSLMTETRTQAIEQAVEAGYLTREQADWMLERMAGAFGRGMMGGFGRGMMGRAGMFNRSDQGGFGCGGMHRGGFFQQTPEAEN